MLQIHIHLTGAILSNCRLDLAPMTGQEALLDHIRFRLRRRHILLPINHTLQHSRRLYPHLSPFHNLIRTSVPMIILVFIPQVLLTVLVLCHSIMALAFPKVALSILQLPAFSLWHL